MKKQRRGPQADSFGYWVFRLNRALHSAFTRRLAAFGVTGPEWAVLGQTGQGGQTPVALAEYMGVDRAAVSRLIAQLEGKGLVRRTAHPTDGRSTVIVLTDAGAALLPRLVAASRETNRQFLSLLPPADAETLAGLVAKLGQLLPHQVFPIDGCEG